MVELVTVNLNEKFSTLAMASKFAEELLETMNSKSSSWDFDSSFVDF